MPATLKRVEDVIATLSKIEMRVTRDTRTQYTGADDAFLQRRIDNAVRIYCALAQADDTDTLPPHW